MPLTPKQILFFAVLNYLSEEAKHKLKNEFVRHNNLSGKKYVEILSTYFDFNLLKNNPIIPEDVWLYNYLLFDCNPKPKSDELDGKIIIKGRLKKTLLLRKYETQVIIPQLKYLKETTRILDSSI